MATIALYAGSTNQMPGLIGDVKKSVMDYKSELFALNSRLLKINSSICDLNDVISSIQASTQTQEDKLTSLNALEKENESFVEEVKQVDADVADVVCSQKDDFYSKYPHLKPDYEKDMLEKAWDGCIAGLATVSEWCKEHWVMIATVLGVIIAAVFAVVTFGVSIIALAALAGLASLVLCAADVICMLATGGKSISDICRENGMGWLGEIFAGISIGCDLVSILFPAGAAIKAMARVGIKSFVKGSIQAAKFVCQEAWKQITKEGFEKGFQYGMKNLGKILFKTFVFDIDDISRVNSSGQRVFDIFEHKTPLDIIHDLPLNSGGLNPDGSVKYIEGNKIDWPPDDGFLGAHPDVTLEPGTVFDRYGGYSGSCASPEGTPYHNRALPPISIDSAYTRFEVNSPVGVQSGHIESWFNEPGGGQQYKFGVYIEELLKKGVLKITDYPQITLKGLTHWGGREVLAGVAGN